MINADINANTYGASCGRNFENQICRLFGYYVTFFMGVILRLPEVLKWDRDVLKLTHSYFSDATKYLHVTIFIIFVT